MDYPWSNLGLTPDTSNASSASYLYYCKCDFSHWPLALFLVSRVDAGLGLQAVSRSRTGRVGHGSFERPLSSVADTICKPLEGTDEVAGESVDTSCNMVYHCRLRFKKETQHTCNHNRIRSSASCALSVYEWVGVVAHSALRGGLRARTAFSRSASLEPWPVWAPREQQRWPLHRSHGFLLSTLNPKMFSSGRMGYDWSWEMGLRPDGWMRYLFWASRRKQWRWVYLMAG